LDHGQSIEVCNISSSYAHETGIKKRKEKKRKEKKKKKKKKKKKEKRSRSRNKQMETELERDPHMLRSRMSPKHSTPMPERES
jgi:ribosomal protein L9